MGGVFGNLATTWRGIWQLLGPAQRFSLVVILFLMLAGMAAVLYMNNQPDWMVVFADLDTAAASKVYELAKDQAIPVQLKNGGRTILVPSRFANELRLSAEKAEITVDRNGEGWELFDNLKLGLTEKQQQVGYQRAIQGELQRMIMELPGVARAQVMVALPQQRAVVQRDQQRATASVLITLANGHFLDAAQVKSIRYLVASSVVGLDPEKVTITDSRGRLLAGRESATNAIGANTQLEANLLLEDQLRTKAETILTPIVGLGNVVASVTVDLDLDQVQKTQESYAADNAVIVSEKVVSEQTASSQGRKGGVAGTASNVVSVSDPNGAPQGTSDNAQESRKTTENQYLVPKMTEHVQRQGWRIRKLSVAVTVARGAERARTAEELASLRALVISAVGAVEDAGNGRHDTIQISEGSFAPAVALEETPRPAALVQRIQPYLGLVPMLRPILGIGLLGVLLLVFRRVFSRTPGDDIQVGSEQLEAINARQVQVDQVGAPAGRRDEEQPLEVIKQRSLTSPEEVGGAVEAMLRANLD